MTDITGYIPHRTPFVMVDDIIHADNIVSKTRFTIRQDMLFTRDGFFTESGLVENMAQTVAAGAGYCARQAGRPVTIGYIGALKNLVITRLPAVGDTITTEVSLVHHIANVHVAEGKVFSGNDQIAGCEMKIFIQPAS